MTAPHLVPPEGRTPAERAAWLAHLAECPACRHAVAIEDPTRLFALLARARIGESVLESVSVGVVAAIVDGRAGRAEPGWAARIAAAAAAVLLAVGAASLAMRPLRPSGPLTAGAPLRAHVTVLDPREGASMIDLTLGETQVVMIYDEKVRL